MFLDFTDTYKVKLGISKNNHLYMVSINWYIMTLVGLIEAKLKVSFFQKDSA
jgi:hypothetical protein